jgi:SNF2 family DNA or RNA helicase
LNSEDDTNQAQVKFKVLTYLTKLRRLCCNPKLIAPEWKDPEIIYRMVTAGTIDEQIQKLHATQRDLTASILAGSDSSEVNSDELIGLLQYGVDLSCSLFTVGKKTEC